MEIRQLKYFVAVANELSIARAAVQLNISQPPLTRQIQQLEEDLGAQLFVRSVKGVELTEAGRTLLADAKSVLALVDLAAERAKRASQGLIGRLDIGTFGAGVYDIVPRILRRFRSLYPEVKIVLHAMNKDQQIEALRQRRISIGFNRLVPKHPDIESRVVLWERLLLVAPSSSPLASRAAISISELADQQFILFPTVARPNFNDFVTSQCQIHGFMPHIALEVGDAVTGVALVASGFGICIVPESVKYFRADGVAYVPLQETPPVLLDLSCLFRVNDDSPLLREFLQVLADFRLENSRDVTASGS